MVPSSITGTPQAHKEYLAIYFFISLFNIYWEPILGTGAPRVHSGKDSACQCRRHKRCRFDPWVRKSPWSRKWQPTPVFSPEKFHGQRSPVGYSPWGCKESDTYMLSAIDRAESEMHMPRLPGLKEACVQLIPLEGEQMQTTMAARQVRVPGQG